MILEASRDFSLLAMAMYYWPWVVVLGLALAQMIIPFIIRRRRSTIIANPPAFFFDENEGQYYYQFPDKDSQWVGSGKPPLPGNYHYSVEDGSFYYSDGELDPYWIQPEDIDWDSGYAQTGSGCLLAITLVVGSIISFIFIGDVHDSMPDPRGQEHRLNVYALGQTPEGEPDLHAHSMSYRPGDQFIDARGNTHDLPITDIFTDENGTPHYGIVRRIVFNNSDRLVRINRYQYETSAMMCGGGADGQLVFALLPYNFYTAAPDMGSYSGMAGRSPGSVMMSGFGGCTSILYWGIEDEPYDGATNPIPPARAREVNEEWLTGSDDPS